MQLCKHTAQLVGGAGATVEALVPGAKRRASEHVSAWPVYVLQDREGIACKGPEWLSPCTRPGSVLNTSYCQCHHPPCGGGLAALRTSHGFGPFYYRCKGPVLTKGTIPDYSGPALLDKVTQEVSASVSCAS